MISYPDTGTFSEKITDQTKIAHMIGQLSKAEKKPAYFKAVYTLRIMYGDTSDVVVICNGNYIKINGLTYDMNKPIRIL